MEILRDPIQLQKILSKQKSTIGFVPTMGALHEGHFFLVEKCRQENSVTVVSLFVNPTQFNNPEDFQKYPQTFQEDCEALQRLGVDYLLAPPFEALYPDNYTYRIEEHSKSLQLCGASRPGHFSGVLTVVMKLLHIVAPQKAYFGEKDFQQLSLIRGLAQAFFLPVEIVGVPTIRDSEGLALSSRNRRLSPEGLEKARRFAKILKTKKSMDEVQNLLLKEGIEVDYLADDENRRFAAVFIENVRLIDNVSL